MPSVMEKHGIRDLRPEAKIGVFEDEIGNLCKPAADDRVVCRELDIALSENVADASRLWRHLLIVALVRRFGLGLSPALTCFEVSQF